MKVKREVKNEKTITATTKRYVPKEEAAETSGLPTRAVCDAGRTEVEPGAMTVVGIVGPVSRVDQVTGHMRTL